MSKISLALIGVALLFSGLHTGRAQEPEIPYLYYYSFQDQGFIIERADGSNQHLLSAPLRSSDHNLMGGPGWSPSGKWLAWWSRPDAGNITRTSAVGYIFSADGQEQLDLLDDVNNIIDMAWSPGGDYLSVLTTSSADNTFDSYGVYLFDVNARQMIAHYEVQQGVGLNMQWAPDGQTLAVIYLSQSTIIQIDILKMDGSHDERKPVDQPFLAVHWHPDGRLGYVDQDSSQLTLEDLNSGDITEIPLNESHVTGIEWSPDGKRAFYFVGESVENQDLATLWLLQADGTQTLIAPDVDLGISTPRWSQDGQQAVFAQTFQDASSETVKKQFVLYDLQTGTSHTITPAVDPSTFLDSFYVAAGYASSHITWGKDAVWLSTDGSVYRYANETTEVIDNAISSPFPSPDGHTVLFKGNCTGRDSIDDWEVPPCLLDQASGTVHMLAPASHTYHMPFKSFRADWHSDSKWVLIEEYAQPGGSFYPQISVASADGSVHRELTGSCYDKSCFGWLPTQVVNLPLASDPIVNRPSELVLHGHTDWVMAVAWSPDGSRLASLDQHGEIIVWDVITGTELQRMYPDSQQIYLEPGTLGWSVDGTRLASWGYNLATDEEWAVTIWNTETGTVVTHLDTATHRVAWEENTPPPFTPDIVTANGLIVDPGGEHLAVAPFSGYGILNNALTSDGHYLFTISLNFSDCTEVPTVTVQNTLTNEVESQTLDAPRHCVGFIAPSLDRKWLTAVQGGTIIWDLETGAIVFQNYAAGNSAAFNPDSTRLAVANSYDLRIWNLMLP
ncbi:MAG: hypothetical protein L0154_02875 [Chloroflexi bacterium]|nr:hypothetical protein [Chloroflexota bacterium]